MTALSRDLIRLARLHGLQTAYDDVRGRRTRASAEAVLAVLAARGVPIGSAGDAGRLLAETERERLHEGLEPVVVCWNRWPLEVPIWVRPAQLGHPARVTVVLEQGDEYGCHTELRVGGNAASGGRFRGTQRGEQPDNGSGRVECTAGNGGPDGPREGESAGNSQTAAASAGSGVRLGGLEQAAAAHGYVPALVPIEGPLPFGYHRLRIVLGPRHYEAWLIVAPRRSLAGRSIASGASAASPDVAEATQSHMGHDGLHEADWLSREARRPKRGLTERGWGCFLPLYALRTAHDWGAGSYSDLAALAEWTGSLGGSAVGTLPLLPCFLDQPFDPSPYAPVSRLMWSEFYIDVARLPELHDAPELGRRLDAPEWHAALEALRARPKVDYREAMARKRQVLEELSRVFFDRATTARRDAFERFLRSVPEVRRYARFRAACERTGRAWPEWPRAMQADRLAARDVDAAVERLYLYAQFAAHEQLAETIEVARRSGVELYLDLPIGVRGDGFDAWREPQLFAHRVSAGAPPDGVFANGQNWGFPPLDPGALRRSGYRYLVDVLRHHLRTSGLLRIDHVMGLHRLYWIAEGMPATDGVYVRYAADELYAVLCLESHRHAGRLVGENLGTVPGYVNRAMRRHRLRTMYVVQYEYAEGVRRVAPPPSRSSVASVNTHDMPTFAAWYAGRDIDDRLALGFLDRAGAVRAKADRERARRLLVTCLQRAGLLKTPADEGAETKNDATRDDLPPCGEVLAACLAYLAESDAELALVNLEDLWLEVEPQNVPGTSHERPNWQRKARYRFEEFREMPSVLEVLRQVARRRGGRGNAKPQPGQAEP